MDDLIYFLLIVGWLAFSLFSNQKKKAKNARPQAPQSTGQPQAKTLEEIFLGPIAKPVPVSESQPEKPYFSYEDFHPADESLETIDDSEAQSSLETFNSEEQYSSRENLSLEEQYMSLNTLKRQSLADERVSSFKQTVFEEEVAEIVEESHSSVHNWRQAIIYSTLLERKYC